MYRIHVSPPSRQLLYKQYVRYWEFARFSAYFPANLPSENVSPLLDSASSWLLSPTHFIEVELLSFEWKGVASFGKLFRAEATIDLLSANSFSLSPAATISVAHGAARSGSQVGPGRVRAMEKIGRDWRKTRIPLGKTSFCVRGRGRSKTG